MKTRIILSFASMLLLASGLTAYGQGNDSGTAPEQKGNTGWTGGAQDHPSQTGETGSTTGQNSSTATQSAQDNEAARSQPLTATGADLNGPAQRFPPTKTPE